MDLVVTPSQPRSLPGPGAAVATIIDRNPFPLDAQMGRGAGRSEALARVLSSFAGPGYRCAPPWQSRPCPSYRAQRLPQRLPRGRGCMYHPSSPRLCVAPTTPVVCSISPLTTPPDVPSVTVVSPGPTAPSSTDDGVVTSTVHLSGETSAFVEGASGPGPSVVRGLDDQQKCLLTFTRP